MGQESRHYLAGWLWSQKGCSQGTDQGYHHLKLYWERIHLQAHSGGSWQASGLISWLAIAVPWHMDFSRGLLNGIFLSLKQRLWEKVWERVKHPTEKPQSFCNPFSELPYYHFWTMLFILIMLLIPSHTEVEGITQGIKNRRWES